MKSNNQWLILRTSDSLDMLEGDYSQVDTSFPLIPDSLQDMEIVSVDVAQNKTSTGNNLIIKMKTTKDNVASGTGDVIPKGFPVTTYIGMTPSDAYPESSIKKAIATFCQAGGLPAPKPFDKWVGKLVTCKVSTRPAKDGYDASNAFKFVPLKQSKA